ncbi:MAG TPA: peptide chain release factor 1 [Candidatus Pacearchaeota archaeon]|nr:peptide chain release factor 1 [Candidatus Pacearchaeota archaeon]
MTKISKAQLGEIIEELEDYRGRQTELISVYIPAGYDVNVVQRQLEAEKSTAKNIKSTATRKNVTDALEKLVRELKSLKKTPENGLALFSGNISKVEGQQDLQLWNIEPPVKVKSRLYRCDKDFVLDPLREILEVSEVFGLIVMDRKEATIGLLEGKRIEVMHKMTSGIPSKVRAGGQSSQRFHRITEGLTRDFYKRIAEEAKTAFFTLKKLKGIIIGGPIPTKDEFIEGEYLTTQLREKIIGKIDIGDSSASGLKELVEKSEDLLVNHERTIEKKNVENFFQNLGENPEKTFLGEENVRRALGMGAVDVLFLSLGLDKILIKGLREIADNMGTVVKTISTETSEGEQFFNMGGIGAILRFSV